MIPQMKVVVLNHDTNLLVESDPKVFEVIIEDRP